MKRVSLFLTAILCLAALSAGCAPTAADPTPTPTVEAIAETPSPTPEPTPEPTPTPSPTPTPEPIVLPIEIEAVRMDRDSINNPRVNLVIKNTSNDLTVDAFEFACYCYNAFGDDVKGYNVYDYFGGIYQEGEIAPGDDFNKDWWWPLYGFDNTTNVRVALTRVHTTDGQTFEVPEDEWIFIEGSLD